MSRVGMIGMGKLGLPVALAIESKGHEVYGYDVRPEPYTYIKERKIPYQEKDLQPLLDKTKITMLSSLWDIAKQSDILFVAVQTPHDPEYEGATPMPDERKDFDYSYLIDVLEKLVTIASTEKPHLTVAVISTCLPGTFNREIKPRLNEYIDYCYVPQFIAMGTVVQDFLHPEFDLIGVDSDKAARLLQEFYSTINDAPHVVTDITTAEGIKVSYNTWITAKTVIANAWGELSYRLGMNFDDLYKAWSLSTKRLISPAYMQAGMSDGGGCHPRDNIALSYIAQETGMSHDIWSDLMTAREKYEEWHGDVAMWRSLQHKLPLVLVGKAFKPGTSIRTGSPALLMAEYIKRFKFPFTHVDDGDKWPKKPGVFFLCVADKGYMMLPYPKGSVVIDPFGIMPDTPKVTVERLGRA